jgi:hypothetical protein
MCLHCVPSLFTVFALLPIALKHLAAGEIPIKMKYAELYHQSLAGGVDKLLNLQRIPINMKV